MLKKVVLRRIFVLSLPVLCIILANLASNAHFKTFCIIKFLTHHPCAGCGLTRAFAELSKFHFKEAYELNPLVFGVAIFFIFAWVMILKKELSVSESSSEGLKVNKKGTD